MSRANRQKCFSDYRLRGISSRIILRSMMTNAKSDRTFTKGDRVVVVSPNHAGHGRIATVSGVITFASIPAVYTVKFRQPVERTETQPFVAPVFSANELEPAICPVCQDGYCEVKSLECGQ